MNRAYGLLLSLAPAALTLSLACSPEFTACDAQGPCAVGGNASGGTAGTAGTAGVGEAGVTEAGGEPGDSGGEGGAPDVSPILFGGCSQKGAVACVEQAGAQRLACDGKLWQAGTTCGANELCDSADGSCAPIVSECASAKPGAVVCREDTLLTCGPDLVTARVGERCAGLCKNGVCQAPVCGDEKLEQGEDCDDAQATASGACVSCKTASCGDGIVYPKHEQCDDGKTISGDGCSATCQIEPIALALGGGTTCVLSATGLVKCWGMSERGVLGLGDTKNRGDVKSQVPRKLPAIDLGTDRTATAISVSSASSACALLDHGEVKCWGNNRFGQLGTGSTDDRGDEPGEMGDALKPIPLGIGRKAVGVSAGSNYSCAVLDDGSVKCWGSGQYGQLGGDSPYDALAPAEFVVVDLKRAATAVSAGDGVTCALLDDGSVKCWGNAAYVPRSDSTDLDASGAVGDFVGEISALSALTFAGGKARSIVAGQVSQAVLEDGSLMLWGFGYQGWTHAGLPPNDFSTLPAMKMGTGRKVSASDVDLYHACATTDDGALSCWGYAYHGALGLGAMLSSSGPVVHDSQGAQTGTISVDLGGRSARQVAVGVEHSCALLDDGTLKCWGYNASGQLGLGDARNRGDTGDRLAADTTVDLAF
jgi:cysteine-rich repeat protein